MKAKSCSPIRKRVCTSHEENISHSSQRGKENHQANIKGVRRKNKSYGRKAIENTPKKKEVIREIHSPLLALEDTQQNSVNMNLLCDFINDANDRVATWLDASNTSNRTSILTNNTTTELSENIHSSCNTQSTTSVISEEEESFVTQLLDEDQQEENVHKILNKRIFPFNNSVVSKYMSIPSKTVNTIRQNNSITENTDSITENTDSISMLNHRNANEDCDVLKADFRLPVNDLEQDLPKFESSSSNIDKEINYLDTELLLVNDRDNFETTPQSIPDLAINIVDELINNERIVPDILQEAEEDWLVAFENDEFWCKDLQDNVNDNVFSLEAAELFRVEETIP